MIPELNSRVRTFENRQQHNRRWEFSFLGLGCLAIIVIGAIDYSYSHWFMYNFFIGLIVFLTLLCVLSTKTFTISPEDRALMHVHNAILTIKSRKSQKNLKCSWRSTARKEIQFAANSLLPTQYAQLIPNSKIDREQAQLMNDLQIAIGKRLAYAVENPKKVNKSRVEQYLNDLAIVLMNPTLQNERIFIETTRNLAMTTSSSRWTYWSDLVHTREAKFCLIVLVSCSLAPGVVALSLIISGDFNPFVWMRQHPGTEIPVVCVLMSILGSLYLPKRK